MGEKRKVYRVLVGKPEGKRPLGRPRHRWKDVVRMDLTEIGLGGVDWIRLAQDRDRWRAVVSAVMNLLVLAPRSYNSNMPSSSSSSSSARQPYVGPGLPQKLLPAEVSGYCFFRFRDKSLFQGGVVSPTPITNMKAYILHLPRA
jgi:hypothetical protein